MEGQHQYLLALALTKGLGPVSVKNLIAYCGSAEAVFSAPKGKLLRAPGIGKKAVAQVRQANKLHLAERELNYCQQHDIEVLTYLDPAYPKALKYIHDAPLILFKKGAIDFNEQPNLAIVGTRKATEYGREMASEFAHFFAEKGLNVVSGLAYGIDIAAHRAALKAKGKTTAILAHGLDTLYPGRHAQRAREMLEKGGWLTEYVTGTQPDAPHFPARNRIISGMCKAVIVIEAAERGGALITAHAAFEQNRQVYALPGRVGDRYSEGCNHLIRKDIARLVSGPQEVLDDLEIHWQHHDDQTEQLEKVLQLSLEPLSPDESKVMNLLSKGEALVDQITLQTAIPMDKLNALLLAMEFKGLLKQLPGKKYKRA